MSSKNKTARLGLNVWEAADSPMRVDFNADNELIDAAVKSIEEQIAANTADHASIRVEVANLLSNASDSINAYARETRRLVLDAYAMAAASEAASLAPSAGGTWVEDFTDISDIDLNESTHYIKSDADDESIIYFGATHGHHPSLGDTFSRTSKSNLALPFTLTESCRIDGLIARPVWSESFSGDLNVTCAVYRATASGSSWKLGEQLWSATKERPHTLKVNMTYTDDYINYVDTPFTLAAGSYVAVFHGDNIRANDYSTGSFAHLENNPRLVPYDKLLTLADGGGVGSTLTVTSGYYPDAAVRWTPTSGAYAPLTTTLLGFDRTISSAAVFVYCDSGDLSCRGSVVGANGKTFALSADPDMQNAPCPSGLYVTKLTGTDTGSANITNAKLRLELRSPSAGTIRRVLMIAMRTEA